MHDGPGMSLPGSYSLKVKAEWNHESSGNLPDQSTFDAHNVPAMGLPGHNLLPKTISLFSSLSHP
jgi:hypothetical protein